MAIDLIPKRLFEKMGVTISVVAYFGSRVDFKAFLQPLRYKNKVYLGGVHTELGYDSMRKHLLISPPDIRLDNIDGVSFSLEFEGKKLSIDHCEKIYFKEKPVYYWAIVSEEG